VEGIAMATQPDPAQSVTLYGDSRSGNCDKVRFTLDYLRFPYEWIEVDSVAGRTREPKFLEINPQGQIPVAIIPTIGRVAQSNAIIRAIAVGTPLVPEGPQLTAKLDEWMFWEANNHEPFVSTCIGHMTYKGQPKETRYEESVRRGNQALDVMEIELNGRQWFVGDRISLADIALIAYTRNAESGGFDLRGRPAVRNWIGRTADALGVEF
jgi:glutathione S-transferase